MHLGNWQCSFPAPATDQRSRKVTGSRSAIERWRRLRPRGLLETPQIQRTFDLFRLHDRFQRVLPLCRGGRGGRQSLVTFNQICLPRDEIGRSRDRRRGEGSRGQVLSGESRRQKRFTVNRPSGLARDARAEPSGTRPCRMDRVEMPAAGCRHSGRSRHRRNASR